MQDLPNNFQPIKYQRNLPSRGPTSIVLILGALGIMTYGWRNYLKGFKEQEELKREQAWIRISLLPFLQAESDRNTVRFLDAAKEKGFQSDYKTEQGAKVLPSKLPLDEDGIQR